ncbi:E3 ubiquitin-protein ligase TRIM39 isoform X2 [Pleuronectes platessa]|uniref:E3 ubiquitin-protein ligase TRIM39 isoform X2 n=1 Tax=Pleuronectes platessa TaxID=8262 RepID=UPI00232A72B5|nr:E3 ubiquitin-protein ligase TRIM39 isoform X2 [Pleuronectes platessa]
MMSSHLAWLSEDRFQCSLCEKVFSDPVTTPCGHNFCKTCLSEHWDGSELCHCPTCSKRFHVRPEVSTNTVIQEISVQVKRRKVETTESIGESSHVECDVCTELKLQAQRSCLVCLTSYCEVHLEPHLRVPSLMRHRLVDPLENLEERMCKKHERILEFFCRQEETCICLLCKETEHKEHETVPLEEEGARQKQNIESKKAEMRKMIEERVEKTKEFTDSSEMSREKAHKEMDRSDQLFSNLISQVQRLQTKLKSNIEAKLTKSQERDKAVIEELHMEISELQRRHEELEELSHKDDSFQLLQTLKALSDVSDLKNWSNLRVYSDLCVQTLRRAMSQLLLTFQAELRALTKTELNRMRQYKEYVLFDGATAGDGLVVTEEGKRLKYIKSASPTWSKGSERFERPAVCGTRGFSSGRHYWEVQVGRRNEWDVGIAKKTVTRTGRVPQNTGNGFFTIGKRRSDYQVHRSPLKELHLCPRPRKVGIYLDYEEGRVSFYDVDEEFHIYSFTRETFTETLLPYFYLCSWAKKSEPLVITYIFDENFVRQYFEKFKKTREVKTSLEGQKLQTPPRSTEVKPPETHSSPDVCVTAVE